jgi:hypothetical protein
MFRRCNVLKMHAADSRFVFQALTMIGCGDFREMFAMGCRRRLFHMLRMVMMFRRRNFRVMMLRDSEVVKMLAMNRRFVLKSLEMIG